MRFRVRNLFYLRLSSSDVIPLYVYLDERHVEWMSERMLQSVVADLRPLVGPKLEAERNAHYGPGGPANAKKGTVEVHRGDTYQFAYFLRKAEPHSIVLKTRNYVMVTRTTQPKIAAPPVQARGNQGGSMTEEDARVGRSAKGTKRTRKATVQTKIASKKAKEKARAIEVIDDSEEEAEESSLTDFEEDNVEQDTGLIVRRRSVRNKRQRRAYRETFDDDYVEESDDIVDEDVEIRAHDDQSVQVKQEATDDSEDAVLQSDVEANDEQTAPEPPLPPDFGIDEDEEEKKLKPELQLSFRSLDMHDRCLCVVVEPWPGLPSRPTPTPFPDRPSSFREPSIAPSTAGTRSDREPSIAPSRFSLGPETDLAGREQTPLPLFLPDPSGRDRSATPAPVRFPTEFSGPGTLDDAQETIGEDDDFGMLAFSQVLNNVSGDRIGATEEDDEMDGGALYGDADEIRSEFQ